MSQHGGVAQQAGSTDTSPIVAGLLSFIIPGVGHIVAGDPVKKRGIFWLAGTAIAFVGLSLFSLITLGLGALLFFGWPIIHIAAAADAYIQVDKIYQGASPM